MLVLDLSEFNCQAACHRKTEHGLLKNKLKNSKTAVVQRRTIEASPPESRDIHKEILRYI